MSKQVQETAEAVTAPIPVSTGVHKDMANSTPQQNLYMNVETFDAQGHTIGSRIVDLYHFGTRNWLQSHMWWAMHNGHCVEVNVATPTQIDEYLASAKQALAEKFNSTAKAA